MPNKRSHGEGSIYRRKDGLWVAALMLQGKRAVKYSKTQREARDWLQETRIQVQSGLTFTAAQITVAQFFREWLINYKDSIRPKTYEQYKQIVNQYITPGIGAVKLKDLRPDQIQLFYTMQLRDGRSQRTVLLIHSVLHRALNQALSWRLIGHNPAEAVNRPKVPRKEMRVLNESQVITLINSAKGSRFETLFWVAVTTGLREGEILGLKWSDIDWVTRRLSVQRQVQRLKNQGSVFSSPKSEAGERAVLLSMDTIKRLRGYHAVQSYEKLFAGDRWRENDLIFPSTVGTPLDQRNLYRNFKTILRQAELPEIRFHDLRHTAATLMLPQGINPKVVQERLGHADITLTLNTYSHVLPEMQEEAVQKLDHALASRQSSFEAIAPEQAADLEPIQLKRNND
jgi:integrase